MTHLVTHHEVRALLPHRYPFLMVDTVLSLEPHQSIVALKNITCNEPFFTGHFPQRLIMPGVLMIEALAQAAGLLVFLSHGWSFNGVSDLFYLAGVDKTRFKKMVEPGDQLHLCVQQVKQRLNIWKFQGQAKVGDEVVCSADFMIVKEDITAKEE